MLNPDFMPVVFAYYLQELKGRFGLRQYAPLTKCTKCYFRDSWP